MRGRGYDDGKEEEDGPGERRREGVGLIDAHPAQVGAERVELIVHVRHAAIVLAAAVQKRRSGGVAHRKWFLSVCGVENWEVERAE